MPVESPLLVTLLESMWQAPLFGGASFAFDDARQAAAARQMETVLADFTMQMDMSLEAGLPDWGERRRHWLLGAMAAKTVAFSPGLSAGEIKNTELLGDMAMLTGLTGVCNTGCDWGDAAMPPATLRLCGDGTAALPAGADPLLVDARFAMLRGIEHKIRRIAADRDDEEVTTRVIFELLRAEVRAHELSMAYRQADDTEAFWQNNAEEAAALLRVTAALPTATTPLYGIYRQEHNELPGLSEIYNEPLMLKLLAAANGIIRVKDDAGDAERDARDESFSIDLFNQPHPLLMRHFCAEVGITNDYTVAELTRGFAQARNLSGKKRVAPVFVDHFRKQFSALPTPLAKRFARYNRLVMRALEAGEVNTVGDDALTEPA